MRVAIAELKQEANTLVPRPTTLADFEAWHLWRGEELISESRDTNTEIAGFLDVLSQAEITAAPILATFAMSGARSRASPFARCSTSCFPDCKAKVPSTACSWRSTGRW